MTIPNNDYSINNGHDSYKFNNARVEPDPVLVPPVLPSSVLCYSISKDVFELVPFPAAIPENLLDINVMQFNGAINDPPAGGDSYIYAEGGGHFRDPISNYGDVPDNFTDIPTRFINYGNYGITQRIRKFIILTSAIPSAERTFAVTVKKINFVASGGEFAGANDTAFTTIVDGLLTDNEGEPIPISKNIRCNERTFTKTVPDTRKGVPAGSETTIQVERLGENAWNQYDTFNVLDADDFAAVPQWNGGTVEDGEGLICKISIRGDPAAIGNTVYYFKVIVFLEDLIQP